MPLWSNTAAPKWVGTANGEKYNIFTTTQGYVERHYKGNQNGSAYWDELLSTQQGLLTGSTPNVISVAITSNANYTSANIASGVGNSFSYLYPANSAAVVFQAPNATANNGVGTVISTSNVVPYIQLAHSGNLAAYVNGSVVFQKNSASSSNNATGILFFANATVIRVQNVNGTFDTSNTVQANATQNSAISAVTANVTGTLLLSRSSGRFTTSNVIQNGFGNITLNSVNNYTTGVVSVYYDEPVIVNTGGGTPYLVVTSNGTTNANATFSYGNNTNRLAFAFTGNGAANANLYVEAQSIAINSGYVNSAANTSVAANVTFTLAKVGNVAFGVGGANVTT